MKDAELKRLCLERADIERVAEFFNCDVDAAFEFARKIWLPDARATASRLSSAIAIRDWTSALYLCDKLREGARCVGAKRIMQYANEIESAAQREESAWLRGKLRELGTALEALGAVLTDGANAAVLPP